MLNQIKSYLSKNDFSNMITIKYLLQYFSEDNINYILFENNKNNKVCISNLEDIQHMNNTFQKDFINNIGIMSYKELNILLQKYLSDNLSYNLLDNLSNNWKEEIIIPKIESINNDVEKKVKYKKKSIPLALKKLVWNKYIGEEIGKAKCLCCGLTDISQISFNCGHIIAEVNSGQLCIDNLMPICQNCNSSMGSKNLLEFKKILRG